MISLCPKCGRKLDIPLIDGIEFCNNCRQTVDCSSINKILSAAWEIRKRGAISQKMLNCLNEYEFKLVNDFVLEKSFCHDDLLKELKKIKFEYEH